MPANYKDALCKDHDFAGESLIGANFRCAILTRANFRGASLRNATFSFADIDRANFIACKDVIDCGVPAGYRVIAVKHDAGMRIKAGCHWLTVPQAKAYWLPRRVIARNRAASPDFPSRWRDDRVEVRAAVDYAIACAKARGWRILPKVK